jgi:hypothetical protein
MDDHDRFRLLFGPYATPVFEYGQTVFCEIRGEVVIHGLSAGPIPWPYYKPRGVRQLIVVADLAKALRVESAIAVAHWWGISYNVVIRWRRALGIERSNPGTHHLRHAYSQTPPFQDSLKKAQINTLKPEAVAKRATAHIGVPLTEETKRKIGHKNRGRSPSAETRRKISLANKGRPNPHIKNRWTPEEDALLQTLPIKEVMCLTGRTRFSCLGRKQWLARRAEYGTEADTDA